VKMSCERKSYEVGMREIEGNVGKTSVVMVGLYKG